MQITRQRQRFSSRVVKFASQVLYSMWVHQELREVYRKAGWKEQDFVTKTIAARNARPNSPTNMNSTLNRPMASQGGTRYEDRTMRAAHAAQGGGHGHAQGTIQAHMANNSVHGYRVSERINKIKCAYRDRLWTKTTFSYSARGRSHGRPVPLRTSRASSVPGRSHVRDGAEPSRKSRSLGLLLIIKLHLELERL